VKPTQHSPLMDARDIRHQLHDCHSASVSCTPASAAEACSSATIGTTLCPEKNIPLCFLLQLLVKLTNLHKNFSIYSGMNTDYKRLKIVHLVVTYFFAIDDEIVMSVNTYMSIMGISTEDKYLIKSLPEN